MKEFNLLNSDDVRFIRHYTRYLHYKLDYVWDVSKINNYNKKSLEQNLITMLNKIKEHNPSDFENQCLAMNESVNNDLLDRTLFEWINSDRADCFTWSLLKAGQLIDEISYPTPRLVRLYRKKFSHICFNTNNNILDYIIWSFDDYDNSYFGDNDRHFKNLKRFGVQQLHQKLVLKEYKERFRYVYDTNNISWINPNNLEQTSWIYSYILKASFSKEYPKLHKLEGFNYITPPATESQYYHTVVAQLDMICDIYLTKEKIWDDFSRKLRKAWSTQSDRLKVKNKEVMLDKACIKMLRDMVGHDASDAVLKKRLKDLIKAEHTEFKKSEGQGKREKLEKLEGQEKSDKQEKRTDRESFENHVNSLNFLDSLDSTATRSVLNNFFKKSK